MKENIKTTALRQSRSLWVDAACSINHGLL